MQGFQVIPVLARAFVVKEYTLPVVELLHRTSMRAGLVLFAGPFPRNRLL
jgi:hypothetical protein